MHRFACHLMSRKCTLRTIWFLGAAMIHVVSGGIAIAESPVDPAAVKSEDGKYLDKEGNPTFKVAPDGHGPDGMGSTYAPALTDSLKTMSYGDFMNVVASGRQNGNSVMPALGDNPNVACYMDDLYVYLRARANDAVGRMRPAKKEDKPEAYTQAENSCMGKQ
jgi:hypothetical protein